jgi:hypothetical protein
MATTKNCKACGSPISQNATLCPVCKTYQQRWKAAVQFGSSSTAFIAAAVSLILWAISQLPTVRVLVWPREDVRVVAANSLSGGVVVNRGDHEVFVSHILLFMTNRSTWEAQRFPIDESLPPGKFLRVAKPKTDFDPGFFVRGVKAANFEKFMENVLSDSTCFQIAFSALDDPLYRETAHAAGPTLNTLSADGYIEYRTVASPSVSRTRVPAIATIRARSTPECMKKVPVDPSPASPFKLEAAPQTERGR